MTEQGGRSAYRASIDALVDECRNGQGTVLPSWARRAVWPPDSEVAELLRRLDSSDREAVARMLEQAYSGAVHDTLRVLEDKGFPNLAQAYEGSPREDFMGRLITDYEWPND
ncbi:DUF6547 family protein [Nocardioides sp.]|uniref:DUF6547 family protein n=1 Tax=Nocardioides sp. TaxID=35761 RepID=UPI002B5301C6|nr:DUF6547 family protein [Nocardioides sp.]HSX67406.1 DUF6547 family protein [Nocardioides sp.]